MKIYRKLFLDGDWQIAFRRKVNWERRFSYDQGFISVCNDKKYWYADPILVADEEKQYLFCEAFDRKQYKGVLGVFEIDNDEVKNFRVIIEEEYHLSYPCVFKHNNEFYMIPESGENETVNLYQAKEFPYVWEMKSQLISGKKYADPTVFMVDQEVYFMAYNGNEGGYVNCIFRIDMNSYTAEEVYNIQYQQNIGRPAGSMFRINTGCVRPAQDSRELYGQNVLLYKMAFEKTGVTENPYFMFNASELIVDDKVGVDRIHTYSTSDKYEAIDYCNYRFKITKRLEILARHRMVNPRRRKREKG